jgi:transcriptional regulator with XRE-family HTH domain
VEEFMAACERIRALSRMTQASFADSLGVKRSTYQYYRDGGTFPVAFVQKVASRYPEMRPYIEALFFGHEANKLAVSQRGKHQERSSRGVVSVSGQRAASI